MPSGHLGVHAPFAFAFCHELFSLIRQCLRWTAIAQSGLGFQFQILEPHFLAQFHAGLLGRPEGRADLPTDGELDQINGRCVARMDVFREVNEFVSA